MSDKCPYCGETNCIHTYRFREEDKIELQTDNDVKFVGAGVFEIPEGVDWDCKFITEEK